MRKTVAILISAVILNLCSACVFVQRDSVEWAERKESASEILMGRGIITEEDKNKDRYISTLEALETIEKMRGYEIDDIPESYLYEWNLNASLKSMNYLDDSAKLLLISLCHGDGCNVVLKYDEIASLNLNANITNYEALLYITRLVGDTYGCMDSATDGSVEKEDIYKTAYDKGLISKTSTRKADKLMTRDEFYNVLHKALFVEYCSGGEAGVEVVRLIDILNRIMANVG